MVATHAIPRLPEMDWMITEGLRLFFDVALVFYASHWRSSPNDYFARL
jgi:hypothetical protein